MPTAHDFRIHIPEGEVAGDLEQARTFCEECGRPIPRRTSSWLVDETNTPRPGNRMIEEEGDEPVPVNEEGEGVFCSKRCAEANADKYHRFKSMTPGVGIESFTCENPGCPNPEYPFSGEEAVLGDVGNDTLAYCSEGCRAMHMGEGQPLPHRDLGPEHGHHEQEFYAGRDMKAEQTSVDRVQDFDQWLNAKGIEVGDPRIDEHYDRFCREEEESHEGLRQGYQKSQSAIDQTAGGALVGGNMHGLGQPRRRTRIYDDSNVGGHAGPGLREGEHGGGPHIQDDYAGGHHGRNLQHGDMRKADNPLDDVPPGSPPMPHGGPPGTPSGRPMPPAPEGGGGHAGSESPGPHGAKIITGLHQELVSIIDKFEPDMKLLENPKVDGKVTKLFDDLASAIDDLADLFKAEYPDLPELPKIAAPEKPTKKPKGEPKPDGEKPEKPEKKDGDDEKPEAKEGKSGHKSGRNYDGSERSGHEHKSQAGGLRKHLESQLARAVTRTRKAQIQEQLDNLDTLEKKAALAESAKSAPAAVAAVTTSTDEKLSPREQAIVAAIERDIARKERMYGLRPLY